MTYNNFQPHPDGSNRVFLATQSGKLFLATMPPQGSGKTLDIDLTNPFIDLTDVVHFDNELGLTGFAFHPNFGTNGRFFVAYNCDKSKSATCSGRCSCNSEINCDPSKLGMDQGARPCQYHAVIAEYTVNGTSTSPNTVYCTSFFILSIILLASCSTRSFLNFFNQSDLDLYASIGLSSYFHLQKTRKIIIKLERGYGTL